MMVHLANTHICGRNVRLMLNKTSAPKKQVFTRVLPCQAHPLNKAQNPLKAQVNTACLQCELKSLHHERTERPKLSGDL